MDNTELRECTNDRLIDLEKTLRRQIFEARIKNFTNQLDDTASIRRARRDLARVKTIMSSRTADDATASGSAVAEASSEAPVSDAGDTAEAEETE